MELHDIEEANTMKANSNTIKAAAELMQSPLWVVVDLLKDTMNEHNLQQKILSFSFKDIDCYVTVERKNENMPNLVEETLRSIEATISYVKRNGGDEEVIKALQEEKTALMDKYGLEYSKEEE